MLASDADYTSFFWRFGPDSELGVSSKQVGDLIVLGEVPAGELILGIYVQNTGETFKTGPGSRNPDGLVHAAIAGSTVGFEDILGGGDFDYNDAMLLLIPEDCEQPTPTPTPVQYTLTLGIEPSSTGSGGLSGGGTYSPGQWLRRTRRPRLAQVSAAGAVTAAASRPRSRW